MNWKQFLKVAYPEKMAIEESHRDILFRSHRWIGLRIGYLLYKLGMSANFISISRIIISTISFYFISQANNKGLWMPLLGTFLLYGQNILDYSDGIVARASGKTSKLGKSLDEIVNVASRGGILVLVSAFTENVFFIAIGAFSSFILINFRDSTVSLIKSNKKFKALNSFYRIILSIQFMLFIFPLLIVTSTILNLKLVTFSYIAICFYLVLAILWLFISLLGKRS
jgi:phosphatidylglycerophosphate synthase